MEYVASKPFHILSCVAIASLGYPLLRARQSEKATSLRHTLNWAILAWGAWLATYVAEMPGMPGRPIHYLALCLCACTAVAVLGARFPGMAAWNFVVCG